MLNIIYSYNKKGSEGECWKKEIASASNEEFTFIPFNHVHYLDPNLYSDAVKLDRLYRDKRSELIQMYNEFEKIIDRYSADAVIVANCPPYHPDFLNKLNIYKVLYSADDPGATYMINIPYLHAYNHVFYVSPCYSEAMDMNDKMHFCGMVNADWLPISVFDFECEPLKTQETIFSQKRDIDIIYVGGFWRQKIDTLVKVRKAFGNRFKLCGFFRLKHNLYLNIRHGYGDWIRPVSNEERTNLYQRSKVGFNIHWDRYGLGNQRLYHLPANGVMQICDCPKHLDQVFRDGKEVVGYYSETDLLDKLRYYLDHSYERSEIAMSGYKRTMREYRFVTVTRKAGELIKVGMERIAWHK